MNTLGSLLFPAQPLTGSLVAAACSGGFFVGIAMRFFRPIKYRLSFRLLRAAGFGGAWGLVACVLVLMLLDSSGARKLTAEELTAAGVLAFLTGALVAAVVLFIAEVVAQRRAARSGLPVVRRPALSSPPSHSRLRR